MNMNTMVINTSEYMFFYFVECLMNFYIFLSRISHIVVYNFIQLYENSSTHLKYITTKSKGKPSKVLCRNESVEYRP